MGTLVTWVSSARLCDILDTIQGSHPYHHQRPVGIWEPLQLKVSEEGDSLAAQWLKLCLLMQGVQVRFPLGELSSHMPCGQNHVK